MMQMTQTKDLPSRTGILEKRGNMWLAWRQRYFVLKGGVLEYSKIGSSKPSGTIPLAGDWKVYPWKFPGRDHAFVLKPPGKGDREYYLSAKTETSKNEWIKDISNTISALAANPSLAPTASATTPGMYDDDIPTSSTQTVSPQPSAAQVAKPVPASANTNSTQKAGIVINEGKDGAKPPAPAAFTAVPVNNEVSAPKSKDETINKPVDIEMASKGPSRVDTEPLLPSEQPSRRACCCFCCARFCAWFSSILYLFICVAAAALGTSYYDPNSTVWGFIVNLWDMLCKEYNNVQAQVFALDKQYQYIIAGCVALVVLLVIVSLICCCVRRRRRAAAQATPFTKLEEEGTQHQTRRQCNRTRRGACSCRCFCAVFFWGLIFAAITIVATSALDSDSNLWHRAVDEYHKLIGQ